MTYENICWPARMALLRIASMLLSVCVCVCVCEGEGGRGTGAGAEGDTGQETCSAR